MEGFTQFGTPTIVIPGVVVAILTVASPRQKIITNCFDASNPEPPSHDNSNAEPPPHDNCCDACWENGGFYTFWDANYCDPQSGGCYPYGGRPTPKDHFKECS